MTPDKYTLEEKTVDVGDGHKVYTQLYGSSDAEQTILFLHGGPGSGCKDGHKNLFNPKHHRVLFVDQRGSGNSTPAGSIENNTTNDLVKDLVKIADEYGIESFVVTGGSWGSTLALMLALRHPNLVDALVIRGVFTSRQVELDFLTKGGVQTFFPDVWDDFVASVPDVHKDDPAAYHQERIFGDDVAVAKKSVYAYSNLEGGVASLDDRFTPMKFEDFEMNAVRIEFFYLANNCFIDEGYILDNAKKISCPLHIVQGRYDTVCPPMTAYELHKAVPGSKLHWTQAGHSGSDRANWEATRAILATLTQ